MVVVWTAAMLTLAILASFRPGRAVAGIDPRR
jgi:hypothetical protein